MSVPSNWDNVRKKLALYVLFVILGAVSSYLFRLRTLVTFTGPYDYL